ncbi:MAG: hypothetical protein K2G30_10525 [Muribaculaceae bacterium]|nr:hypothetical protein [Muribaculaceae bacterium]
MEKTEIALRRIAAVLTLAVCCFGSAFCAGRWELGAGVRDSYHINFRAAYGGHAFVAAEHSVYSYEVRYQYWRLYAGGMVSVPYAEFEGSAFYGRTWCGSYMSAGALLSAKVLPPGPVSVFGTLNPLYDSGLKYNTCFSAGLAVRIFKPVSLRASYTTIPEFRESEKRVRAGVEVRVGGLSVLPELSLPTDRAHRSRSLRLLMSFSYTFFTGK